MAQQKSDERVAIEQVLKLVDQLSPAAREQLLGELKLQKLQRDLQTGIDEADRGELVSEEEVLDHLDTCRKKVLGL
jgi:predicted transcriptional regulator